MDFVKSRQALIWISAVLAFAICWGWAISSFGTIGLYAGWIAAAIVAPLAGIAVSLLWTLVALTVLLGWHFHAADRGDVGPSA
jgi:hypothetical protein